MSSPEDEIDTLLHELDEREQEIEFDFFRLVLADEEILYSNSPHTYFSIHTDGRDISSMMLEAVSFGILWEQENPRYDDSNPSVSAPCGYFSTDDIVKNAKNQQSKDVLHLIKTDLEKGVALDNIDIEGVSNFAHLKEWIVSSLLLGVYFGQAIEAAGFETVTIPTEEVYDELERKYTS